jgi:hypothetical protein
MEDLVMIIIGALFFFPILYFIVRDAVAEGTLKALKGHEEMKNHVIYNKEIKS